MQPYEQLEQKFGEWNKIHNPNLMVAVASGTAALHVALEALELPLGSEVIVPDFTMVACARAVVMAGLVPVFVDCGQDLNINVDLLEAAITNKTSAIMAVHIYGRRCNMGAIHVFALQHNLRVIEDVAEAHGVLPHEGTDAACWSFYKNKIIAGEEGGMIAFRHPSRATLARSLRSLGFTPEHDFNHVPRGVNARMSNAHAKSILESLDQYEQNAFRRRAIEEQYNSMIPNLWQLPERNAVWVYDLELPTGVDNTLLVKSLNSLGIQARLSFKPMHSQREFQEYYCITSAREGSIATEMSERVIYLPCDPRLTDGEVRSIARTVVTACST